MYRHKGQHYDRPTFDMFVPTVLSRTECPKHKVPVGIPCFHITTVGREGTYRPGICNKRATKAGYVGKINPASLSRTQKK